jgi:hypothetical protein
MVCRRSRRNCFRFPRRVAGFGLALLCAGGLLLAGCGQRIRSDFVPSEAQPVFFGLTVNDFANVKPLVAFGTTRSWDAYKGLDWAEENPASGQFDFAALNAFIGINQARGAEMIYTFGRTPQWASTNPNAPGPYGPGECGAPNLAAWDQYVTAVATAAAGRIHYWELWNEPNDPEFYCGDTATMVTMAQQAYAIIKSMDPSAKVLSPAPAGNAGPAWLEDFLARGGGSAVDILAFHGYGTANAEDVTSIADSYRQAMTDDGGLSMPMWDTEGSWGDSAIGDDAHRAAFVAKYFVLQWSKGVERVVWYAYDNNGCWGRLIGPTSQLSAAGVAYGETYKWTVGATLTKACSVDGDGTWACSLTRPGGYEAEIVWNSTQSASYAVPNAMAEYRDLAGKSKPIANGVVPVGNSPILVEPGIPSN